MAGETIFQHFIFQDFMIPFVFICVLVFAVLQKTKILGENKYQLDGIVSAVIALVFVSFAYPKLVVTNLVLVFTVAMVVIFMGLLLWGFITGADAKFDLSGSKGLKWVIGIVLVLFLAISIFWAAGWDFGSKGIIDYLFYQDWSGSFWTNFLFAGVIAGVIAVILATSKNASS